MSACKRYLQCLKDADGFANTHGASDTTASLLPGTTSSTLVFHRGQDIGSFILLGNTHGSDKLQCSVSEGHVCKQDMLTNCSMHINVFSAVLFPVSLCVECNNPVASSWVQKY